MCAITDKPVGESSEERREDLGVKRMQEVAKYRDVLKPPRRRLEKTRRRYLKVFEESSAHDGRNVSKKSKCRRKESSRRW